MAPPAPLQGAAFHDHDNTGPRASHSIPNGGVFSVYSSTTINAPPKAVYDALLDVLDWKAWNTSVDNVTITSHPHPHHKNPVMMEGVNMKFDMRVAPTENITNRVSCSRVEPLKTRSSHEPPCITRIRWDLNNASVMVPGFLMKAQHTNEIEEAEDGTTLYRMWETFGGFLAKNVRKKHEAALKERFEDWCRDLKRYVEEKQTRTGAGKEYAGDKADGVVAGA